MKQIRIGSPQDVLALLVRRKWWIIVPFVALMSAISLLTFLLPRTYVSESLVVIKPREVPRDIVQNLVSGTTQERLKGIEQTVLSRTNLAAIVHQFEDRLVDYRLLDEEQRVAKLRARIGVTFDGSRSDIGRDGVTYFRVSFQHGDPKLTQDIAEKVTSLFVNQDKVDRDGQVSGTTAFLAESLAKAQEELRLSDAKLKQLKEAKRFEMPEQGLSIMNTLERLGQDRRANKESLDRLKTQRSNLDLQIAETNPQITDIVKVKRPGAPKPKPVNAKVEVLRQKELQLQALKARYQDSYREVRLLQAEVDELRASIPPEDLDPRPEPVADEESETVVSKPNPVYTSLMRQVNALETEIKLRETEGKNIELDYAKHDLRLSNISKTEIELSDILRENKNLNDEYQDLKAKHTQAQLSQDLENSKQGSSFDIIDPANYPLAPVKPVRWMILLAGVGISLGAGLACAVLVDILDQRYWTQTELEAALGVPILAEIPRIVTEGDTKSAKRKRLALAASMATGAAVYACGLYLVYLKQASVLRGLEPFIQKLVY